jgi:hypothetical protein
MGSQKQRPSLCSDRAPSKDETGVVSSKRRAETWSNRFDPDSHPEQTPLVKNNKVKGSAPRFVGDGDGASVGLSDDPEVGESLGASLGIALSLGELVPVAPIVCKNRSSEYASSYSSERSRRATTSTTSASFKVRKRGSQSSSACTLYVFTRPPVNIPRSVSVKSSGTPSKSILAKARKSLKSLHSETATSDKLRVSSTSSANLGSFLRLPRNSSTFILRCSTPAGQTQLSTGCLSLRCCFKDESFLVVGVDT